MDIIELADDANSKLYLSASSNTLDMELYYYKNTQKIVQILINNDTIKIIQNILSHDEIDNVYLEFYGKKRLPLLEQILKNAKINTLFITVDCDEIFEPAIMLLNLPVRIKECNIVVNNHMNLYLSKLIHIITNMKHINKKVVNFQGETPDIIELPMNWHIGEKMVYNTKF